MCVCFDSVLSLDDRGWCICSIRGLCKKVIDQRRRSWQTLRTLLGVALSGHHSGSKRNTRNSKTIIEKHHHQLLAGVVVVVVGPATTRMPHRKQRVGAVVGAHKSGMLVITTVATTTTTSRIRTTNRMRTRTIMKSVIGSVSKIRTGSKKIPCAAGVRNRKVCVITGAGGRNRPGRPSYLGSTEIVEQPMEVSDFAY